MEAFGLPTSFGRAANVNANSNQQNNRQKNNGRGGRQGDQGARTSPYPVQAGNSVEGTPVEGFQGRGRGRGRGRGGGGRGRGGIRGDSDSRGPPPAYRTGFTKEQTETGTAFYSESFFENPWAPLEPKL